MVVLTTWPKEAPAASRTPRRFSITRSACARTSPFTISCVFGSRAICPLVKTRSPATIAWEYGPIALGAASVAITWFAMGARDIGRTAAGQAGRGLDALDGVHAG